MTLEKLNLQITTPEDDNNTDPEFIRLRDSLMSLKQPLLDAIANKDLPKAEELHTKALEAKAKLEAYKEGLKNNDQENKNLNKKEEYKTVEINGTKIELGPELGEMIFDEIPAKLEEFNKTLKPGEKLWRVLTKEEFKEIGKTIITIFGNESLTKEQKQKNIKEKLESLGLVYDRQYWVGAPKLTIMDLVWSWYSSDGGLYGGDKDFKFLVQLVR